MSMSRGFSMFLFEGAKVSKQLLSRALSDPNNTMGFEVEFLLLGAQNFLTKYHTSNLETMDRGGGEFHVKRLGDFTWSDVTHFLQPLGIGQHETKDNIEVLQDRLEDAYAQEFGKPRTYNYARMWERLTQKYRVHELLAMFRMFPEHRVMDVPEGQTKALRDVAYDGDVEQIRPYGKINDVKVATAERGYEDEDYDIRTNEQSRAALYDLVAQDISRQLGVEVTYTADSTKVKQMSGRYQTWVVTSESSLNNEEVHGGVVGIELISPVMTAAEGIQMLPRILAMLRGEILGLEVVTTKGTGLHVNIGDGGKEIDAVKLLVLLGDEHMLKKFNREANQHAESIRQELRKRAQAARRGEAATTLTPNDLIRAVQEVLSKVQVERDDLQRLLALLNQLKPEGKGFSVNFSKLGDGFVEFRALGNADYENRESEIMQAIHQMLMVMVAATDPSVYRKEFLKKLYQMVISPEEPQPQQIAASVGTIGGQAGMPGGYGPRNYAQDRPTPYDGENYIEYGLDPGSDTQ